MRSLILIAISIFFGMQAVCQTDKGYWLASGSLSYYQENYQEREEKISRLSIVPKIGYFLINNFAAGLSLESNITVQTLPSQKNRIIVNIVGPFGRYYLLKPGGIFNVFTEASVGFGKITQKPYNTKGNIFQYSVSGGPVFYFTNSVGLELIGGYRSTTYKYSQNNSRANTPFVAIGFAVHLIKDEN